MYMAVDPEGHHWTFSQPVQNRLQRRNGASKRVQVQDIDVTDNLDRTLAALADPHRRRVVDLLRDRPRRAGELAEAARISFPAMSRHLKTLAQERAGGRRPRRI